MGNIGNNLLLVFTVFVIVAGGLMALLIGLVLPNHFHHEVGGYSHYSSEIEGRHFKPKSNIHPYIRERNKRRTYGRIWNFPWLVSISIPVHLDDSFAKYACTGTVISTDKVLTGDDCIHAPLKEEDFRRCIVRSESEYFSEGGVVHQVVNYMSSKSAGLVPPYDALYILQVFPDFSKYVEIVGLYSPTITWNAVIEAGWGGNKIAHVDILKRDPFYYEKWYRSKEHCCNNIDPCPYCGKVPTVACSLEAVLQGNFKSSKINGRPLVTINGSSPTILIGIQMNHEYDTDSSTFIDLRYEEFLKWARNSTSNQNGHKDPCTEKIKLHRMVHFYGCDEKNRDSYLYAFGLKSALGKIINIEDCGTLGPTIPSTTEVRGGTDKQTNSRAVPKESVDISIIGGETTLSIDTNPRTEKITDTGIDTKNIVEKDTYITETEIYFRGDTDNEHIAETSIISSSTRNIIDRTHFDTAHDADIVTETESTTTFTNGTESDIITGNDFVGKNKAIFLIKLCVNPNVGTKTTGDSLETTTNAVIIPRNDISSSGGIENTFMNGKTETSAETTPRTENKSSTSTEAISETDFSTAITFKTGIKTGSYSDAELLTGLSNTTEMRTENNFGTGFETSFVDGQTESTTGTKSSTRTGSSNETEVSSAIVFITEMKTGTYTDTAIVKSITDNTEMRTEIGFGTGFEKNIMNGKTDTLTKTKLGFKISVGTTGDSESTTETKSSTSMDTDASTVPDTGAYTEAEIFAGPTNVNRMSPKICFISGFETSSGSDKTNALAETTPVSYTAPEMNVCTTEKTELTSETRSSTSIEANTETEVSSAIVSITEIKTGTNTDSEIVTGLTDETDMWTEIAFGTGFEKKIMSSKTETIAKTNFGFEITEGTSAETNSTTMEASTDTATGAYTEAKIFTGPTNVTRMRPKIGSTSGFETTAVSDIINALAETTLVSHTAPEMTAETETTYETKSSTSIEANTEPDVSSAILLIEPYDSVSYTAREITEDTTMEDKTKSRTSEEASTENNVSTKTDVRNETDYGTDITIKTEIKTWAHTGAKIVTGLTDETDMWTEIGFGTGFEKKIMRGKTETIAKTNFGFEITEGTTAESESTTETNSSTSMEASTDTDVNTVTATGAYTEAKIFTGTTNVTRMRPKIGSTSGFQTSSVSDKINALAETTLVSHTAPEMTAETETTYETKSSKSIEANTETEVSSAILLIEPYDSVSYTAREITEDTTMEAKTKSRTSEEASTENNVSTKTNVRNETDYGTDIFKTEIKTWAHTDAEIVTGLTDETNMWTEISFGTGFEKQIISGKTETVAETNLGYEITVGTTEDSESTTETNSSKSMEDSTDTDVSTVTASGAYTEAKIFTRHTNMTRMRPKIASTSGFETSSVSDKINALAKTTLVSYTAPEMTVETESTYETKSSTSIKANTETEISSAILFIEPYDSVSYSARQITEGTTMETKTKSNTSEEASTETNVSTKTDVRIETDHGTDITFKTEVKTGAYADAEILGGLTNATETRTEIISSTWFEMGFVSGKSDTVIETAIGIRISPETFSDIIEEKHSSVSNTAREITVCTEENASSTETKLSTSLEASTDTDVSSDMGLKAEMKTKAYTEIVTGLTDGDVTEMSIEIGSSTWIEKSFVSKETDTVAEITLEIESSTKTSSEITKELYDFVPYTAHEITICTIEETESTSETESSTSTETSTETDVSREIVFNTKMKTIDYTVGKIITDAAVVPTEIGSSTGIETSFESDKTDRVIETSHIVESSPKTSLEIFKGTSSSISHTASQITVDTTEETESTAGNESSTSIEASIETVISTEIVVKTEIKTGPHTNFKECTELTDTTEMRTDIDSGSMFKTSFVSNITDAVVETSIGIESSTRTSLESTGEPYGFISYTAQDIPVRTSEESESITSIEASTETDISTDMVFKNDIEIEAKADTKLVTELTEKSFVSRKTDTVAEITLGIDSSTKTSSEITKEPYDFVSYTAHEITMCTIEETELTNKTKSSTSTETSSETDVSREVVFNTEIKPSDYTVGKIITDAADMCTEIGSSTMIETSFESDKIDTVIETSHVVESSPKTSSEITKETSSSASQTTWKITVDTTEKTESTAGNESSTSIEASIETVISTEIVFNTEIKTGPHTNSKEGTELTDTTDMRTDIDSGSVFKTSFVSNVSNAVVETSIGIESSTRTRSEITEEPHGFISYTAQNIPVRTTEESESITSIEARTETDVSTDIVFKTDIETGAYTDAELITGLTDTTEMRTDVDSGSVFKTSFVSNITDAVVETSIGIESSTRTSLESTGEPYGFISYTAQDIPVRTSEESESITSIEASTETDITTDMVCKNDIEIEAKADTELVTELTELTEMWIEIGYSTGLEKSFVSRETDTVAEITLGIDSSTKTSSEITKKPYDFVTYTAHEFTMCTIEETESISETKSSTSTETSSVTDVSREVVFNTDIKPSDYTVGKIITDAADMCSEIGSSTTIETSFESDKIDTVIETSHVVESSPKTSSEITKETSSSVSQTTWKITVDTTEKTESTAGKESYTSIETSIETVISTEIVFNTEIKTGHHTNSRESTELTDTTNMRTDIDSGIVFKTSFVSNVTDAVVETSIGIESSTRTSSEITEEPYSFLSYTAQNIHVRTTEESESITSIEARTETDVSTDIVFKTDIETGAYADAELITGLTDTTEMRTDIDSGSVFKTSFVSNVTDAVVETSIGIESSTRTSSEITEEPYGFISYTAQNIDVRTTEESESITSIEARTETDVSTDIVFKTDIETGAYSDAELITGLTDTTEMRTDIDSGSVFKTSFVSDVTDAVVETSIGIESSTRTSLESTGEPYGFISYTAQDIPVRTSEESESITSIEARTETDVSTDIVFKTDIETGAYADAELITGLTDATRKRTEIDSGTGLKTVTLAEANFGIDITVGPTEESESTSKCKEASNESDDTKEVGFKTDMKTDTEIITELTYATEVQTEFGSGTGLETRFISSTTNTVAVTNRIEITLATTGESKSTETISSTNMDGSIETNVSTESVFKTDLETEAYTVSEIVTRLTDVTEMRSDVGFGAGHKTNFLNDKTHTVTEPIFGIGSDTKTSMKISVEPYGSVSFTDRGVTLCTTEETESTDEIKSSTSTEASTKIVSKTEIDVESALVIDSSTKTSSESTEEPYGFVPYIALDFTVNTTEETESTTSISLEASTASDVSTEIVYKTNMKTESYTDDKVVSGPNDSTEMRPEIVFSTGFETSFVCDKTYTVAETTLGIGSNNKTSTDVTVEPYGFVSFTDRGVTQCTTKETESAAEIKSSTSIDASTETDISIEIVSKTEIAAASYTDAEIVAGLTDVTQMISEIDSSTGLERSFVNDMTQTVAETNLGVESSTRMDKTESTTETKASTSAETSTATITSTETDVSTGTDVSAEIVIKTEIETEAHTYFEVITGFTHATETRTEVKSFNDSNMSSESTDVTSKPKYNESIAVVELEEVDALNEKISVISAITSEITKELNNSSTITSYIGSDRSSASSEISTAVSFTSEIVTEASSATERQISNESTTVFSSNNEKQFLSTEVWSSGETIAASAITSGTEIVSATNSDIMEKTYSTMAETTTETESNTEVDTETDDGDGIETSTELKTDAQIDFRKVNEITNAPDMSFGTEIKSISGFSVSSGVTNVVDITTEFNITSESIAIAENDSDGSTNYASDISTFTTSTTSNITGGIGGLLTENQTEATDSIFNINIRDNSSTKSYSQNITTIVTRSEPNDITETKNDTEIVSSFKTKARDRNSISSIKTLVPTEVYSTLLVAVGDETEPVMRSNLLSTEVDGVNSNLDVGAHTKTTVFEETELVTSTVAASESCDETPIGTTLDIATVTQVCTDPSCYRFEYSTAVPENETSTEKQLSFDDVFNTAFRAKTDIATAFIPTQSSDGIETDSTETEKVSYVTETGTYNETDLTNKINTNTEIATAINYSTNKSFISDKIIAISFTNGNRTEKKSISNATVSNDEIRIITTEIVFHTVTPNIGTTEYYETNSMTLIPSVYESGYYSSPNDSEKIEETESDNRFHIRHLSSYTNENIITDAYSSTLVSLPGDANATSTTETIIKTGAEYTAKSRISLGTIFNMVTDSSELSSTEAMPYVISSTITTFETSTKSSARKEFTSATVVYNIKDIISIDKLPPSKKKDNHIFDENESFGNYGDDEDIIKW